MNQTVEVEVGFARRAEALHLQGESAEALRVLTAGVRRFPGDVTARLVLARVCREDGRAEESRDWLRAALRLDPECPAANDALSLLLPSPEPAPAQAGGRGAGGAALSLSKREGVSPTSAKTKILETTGTPSPLPATSDVSGEVTPPKKPAPMVPSSFVFPVHEEDEEPEIDEDSAPHVATVTLAEIYLQQGLKEQAAQIYRQLLERQPDDESVRKRLQEILQETEGS